MQVALPIQGGLILDAGTAVIREGETTTLDLCRDGLAECRLKVEGEEAAPVIQVYVVDAEGRSLTNGRVTVEGAALRVLYPRIAAGLVLYRARYEVIRLDAPRGDVAVHWKIATPK